MKQRLVIGCGNTLRSDDGIGWRLAMALSNLDLPGLRVEAVHQLTPELAPLIAEAEAVVFVDAALAPATETTQPLALQRLGDHVGTQPFSHQLTPRQLLALSQQLYGGEPPAWLLLLPVHELTIGDQLSPAAARAMEQALALLRHWAQPEHKHA
jgi:hydrogenase maturation protease